ncbi:MAG TPA: hypothetical protein VKB26_00110 [Candidatus Acidoferrales bacterium]|nr:hypothetical protein [Candidatus Acidoferrales bacterium]
MKRLLVLSILVLGFSLSFLGSAGSSPANSNSATIKGWISDEGCARGRANGGTFTGTNPECAKKCIASGAKMVLIAPDQRKLLTVANPSAAKANIGDFVEVTGSVEAKTKTVHIDTLKMLTKGAAMCDAPAKK